LCPVLGSVIENRMFNRFIYRREWSFRIYRETLSRFSCAASMTIQLLPITGIPLPFISYGGSALWSMMTGIGIVLSIYYHEPKRYVDLYHPKSN
ncbi:FtsW/RodA/SpoVE family cell cycle protein, partial [Staphylococcus aureus]